MEWITHSEAALDSVARAVAAHLGGRRKIALYGELGSGKTAFVRAFCRYLGVRDRPSSPTFSLINVYRYPDAGREALVHHIDLYRLTRLEEALDIGLEEILDDPWFCFIEWPERIDALLPADTARLYVDMPDPVTHRFVLRLPDPGPDAV